jgi:uroporphyrin-III C-methyltransferase
MPSGKVYIVGAGPGAPDLISLRGCRALVAADAVLADRLLPRDFLEQLGIPAADKVVQWLGDDQPRWSQDAINRWLAMHAERGQTVARLKGGDPLVFGRGDDEVQYLAHRGIPWEIIPGPSSCTAVPTVAGHPLTRHAQGRSFAVATARVTGGAIQESFPRADSLVVMMGVGVLPPVVERLLADGWASDTPAAIVERGTLPWERRLSGPLGQIAELARRAGVDSPALVIVGGAAVPTVAHGGRPRVLFTGLDPENFRDLGDLLHWPALTTVRDQEGNRLLRSVFARLRYSGFDWIVLTGKLAATSLFAAMAEHGLDARILAGAKVAVVGPAAAMRLHERFIRPDAVAAGPEDSAWVDRLAGQRVAAIHGTHASQEVRNRLDEVAASVTHVTLHGVAPHPELGRPLPEHDAIYFVSPSGVDAFWDAYGPAAFRKDVWCLGEATRAAAAGRGVEATIVVPLSAAWSGMSGALSGANPPR